MPVSACSRDLPQAAQLAQARLLLPAERVHSSTSFQQPHAEEDNFMR